MREFKFRSWDNDEKRFWYFTLQEILERRMSYRGSFDEKILRGDKQQYTGLKDKNGKEIYEGDITRDYYGDVCQIVYRDAGFLVDNDNLECALYIDHSLLEVIGNIYENPELLANQI